MLSNELKSQIQQAYSSFLQTKGLKPRYGQRLMIAEIAKVLGAVKADDKGLRISDAAIIAVEAGTGIGKTVGYSLPAIVCAQASEKKLIISTATVALQEQVIYKDLPDITKHSGLTFSYALAKGRGRYLCLTKLDQLLQEDQYSTSSLFDEEIALSISQASTTLYKKMLQKLSANTWNGDRDTWAEPIEDQDWVRLITEHSQCTNRQCTHFQQCAFFKARAQLDDVDIIVTNHDLVLADLALGGGMILPAPQDSIYIFDEGHHLPNKAINHFSYFVRLQATADWLEQTSRTITKLLKQNALQNEFGKLLETIPSINDRLKQHHQFMLTACRGLLHIPEHADDNEQVQYRFNHGIVPEELTALAIELKKGFAELTDCLTRLTDQLKEAIDGKLNLMIPSYIAEDWYPAFGSLLARAENSWGLWSNFSAPNKEDTPPTARWLTLITSGNYLDIEVSVSPILAAEMLQQNLWHRAYAAAITSATLTALGKFNRFTMHAGLPSSATTLVVPSPFRYHEMGTLKIPNIKADPRDAEAHTKAIITLLPQVMTKTGGCLILFSSKKQMHDVYQGLPEEWQQNILIQSALSKQELIKQHKSRIDNKKTSILFGLASLAEGIDLPGLYCEQVVIAKIPFAVPDDPIEATLAEWIETRGGNPFMEITVPDASLRLIQACGRLIRTEQDKGTIILLDRRIVTKSYGHALLSALPAFKQEIE